TLDERDEEIFSVDLFNPINVSLGRSQGFGAIRDDDPLPVLSITDAAVIEGNSGTTNAIFVVSLSVVSGREVTVNYSISNGTAVAGTDFQWASGISSLFIPPGAPSVRITVPVFGDTVVEP